MPWVGRASGLDDPGDGLGGFGDHVAGLVLVARGHLLENVAIGLLDEHVGHCVANAAADLGYGDPRGNARLREVLCGWLATTRGVRTDPDGIIVVAGQRAIAVEDRAPAAPGRSWPTGVCSDPRPRSKPNPHCLLELVAVGDASENE